MEGNYIGQIEEKIQGHEMLRLTKREATYLRFTYFRGRKKRGKEKEAESTYLDYNNKYSFGTASTRPLSISWSLALAVFSVKSFALFM